MSQRSRPLGRALSKVACHTLLGVLIASFVAFSLLRGADTYYDLLNIKWYSGWSILHGNFDLGGIASTRVTQPPVHDVLQVLLNGPNIWWVPPLVNAVVHSLTTLVVASCCRALLPSANPWAAAVFGGLALASPLVLTQLGTSSGHLYSALALAGALRFLLAAQDDTPKVYFAGCLLALAVLAKSSTLALLPPLLIGAILITGSGSAALSIFSGLATVYGLVTLPWAAFATLGAGRPISHVWFPGVPRPGLLPKAGQTYVVVLAVVVVVVGVRRLRRTFGDSAKSLDERLDRRVFWALLTMSLVATFVMSAVVRRTAVDFRFRLESWRELFGRATHTGDLAFGFQTLDLEVGYFDTRVPIASSLLVVAMVIFLARGSAESRRISGVLIFCSLPVVLNIWSTGYTRYCIEVLPLLPVAIVAVSTHESTSEWVRRAVLGFGALVLLFPMLPNGRLSSGVPRLGQVEFVDAIYEPYLSDDEVEMISDLLPREGLVFGVGSLISYVAPRINRIDLDWSFERPSRQEVENLPNEFSIIYQPAESMALSKYVDRGILLERCEVLRFRYADVGWCSARVDREV